MPLMWRGRGRRSRSRQVLIIHQVAVIAHAALYGQRGRGLSFLLAAHAVELQIGACVQAEGQLDSRGDGRGPQSGRGGPRGHTEPAVSCLQIDHLTLWSLGPEGADRL